MIRGYNTSDSYALAIGHLADRLAGGPALAAPWPNAATRLDKAGLQALGAAYRDQLAEGRSAEPAAAVGAVHAVQAAFEALDRNANETLLLQSLLLQLPPG